MTLKTIAAAAVVAFSTAGAAFAQDPEAKRSCTDIIADLEQAVIEYSDNEQRTAKGAMAVADAYMQLIV